jgi:hypothetical protein
MMVMMMTILMLLMILMMVMMMMLLSSQYHHGLTQPVSCPGILGRKRCVREGPGPFAQGAGGRCADGGDVHPFRGGHSAINIPRDLVPSMHWSGSSGPSPLVMHTE